MISFCVSNQINYKFDICHGIPVNSKRYLTERLYLVLSNVLNF